MSSFFSLRCVCVYVCGHEHSVYGPSSSHPTVRLFLSFLLYPSCPGSLTHSSTARSATEPGRTWPPCVSEAAGNRHAAVRGPPAEAGRVQLLFCELPPCANVAVCVAMCAWMCVFLPAFVVCLVRMLCDGSVRFVRSFSPHTCPPVVTRCQQFSLPRARPPNDDRHGMCEFPAPLHAHVHSHCLL